MSENHLFLTELVGLRVFDLKHRTIGRVKDAALVPLVDPVRVDRYLIGAGHTWLTVRYDQVRAIGLEGIELSDEQLTPYHSDEYMLRMVRDLMDQQIIDAHGRKVVRVTDLTFEIQQRNGFAGLYMLEVDIGLRSIFRRLMQGVMPPKWIRKLQQPIPPNSIRWEFANIIEPDPMRRLRLNISPTQLANMHPADLADIVEELGPEGRQAIIRLLDSESAAETLSEVDPDIQASILESLDAEKAAAIIEEMSPDAAADLLQELEEKTSEEILEEMESEDKTELQELLEYDEDTAGGMMNTEFVAVPASATVGDAIRALRSAPDLVDTTNTLFLTDESDRLVGALPLARLFVEPDTQALSSLAEMEPLFVAAGSRQSKVTEIFDKYNLLTLPVVDEAGVLVGVITADDVISVLRGSR